MENMEPISDDLTEEQISGLIISYKEKFDKLNEYRSLIPELETKVKDNNRDLHYILEKNKAKPKQVYRKDCCPKKGKKCEDEEETK